MSSDVGEDAAPGDAESACDRAFRDQQHYGTLYRRRHTGRKGADSVASRPHLGQIVRGI